MQVFRADRGARHARFRAASPSHTMFVAWAVGIFLLGLAPAYSQTQNSSFSDGAVGPCAGSGAVIRINVKEIRQATGMLVADLHGDNPHDFLKKGKKLKRVRTPARLGSVELCIPVDAPGVYAVAVYHDKNGNRKLDKSWIGIPVEPYGVSNNPGFRLGPPLFGDAAFEVDNRGATLTITLRH